MSKKGAKTQANEQTYEIRDVVLAKVRGYPAWPGMVVDPDNVPPGVAKERPMSKSKKGQWYCIRFFPAGDYAWMVSKDMSKLQQREIQAYIDEPFKRSGELLAGYKIALDPKKWEEEREAAQAEAAEAEANAEVDQLEESEAEGEGEGEDEEKLKTKKRKRESEAAPPKTKTKAKAKKEPAEPKKKTTTVSKSKKNGLKSKALVESEDEAAEEDEDAGPSKKSSPPPAKKQKRDKDEDEGDSLLSNDPEALKVRDWRHKLQKAFLGKAAPKEEDMVGLDQLFTTVETYEQMSIQYLTFSKIGKVMRHIHALNVDKVPRDDDFRFRDRAKTLVEKWHEILSASKSSEGSVRKPATNGKAHAGDSDTKSKETNGKEESPAQENTKSEADTMEIEKKDGTADAEAEADAPADTDDAPADGTADESALADVTMSESAA